MDTNTLLTEIIPQLGVAIIFIWLYLRSEKEKKELLEKKDAREKELIELLLNLKNREAERAKETALMAEKVATSLDKSAEASKTLMEQTQKCSERMISEMSVSMEKNVRASEEIVKKNGEFYEDFKEAIVTAFGNLTDKVASILSGSSKRKSVVREAE